MVTYRGTARNDRLIGTTGRDVLLGLAGDDQLWGLAGNDQLDGGTGRDRLVGDLGNDTYWIDHPRDQIVEAANQGTDTAIASISWQLPDHVENLQLAGMARINGTGNRLDNLLLGNRANNYLRGLGGTDLLFGLQGSDRLDGGTGGDILIGGAGNDTYIVDSLADITSEKNITSYRQYLSLDSIQEIANLADAGGDDWVQSSIDYILPRDFRLSGTIENLELLGNAEEGIGNSLDNIIYGNQVNNALNGGPGDDALQGRGGNDVLEGSTGNDILLGGAGNDVLAGGNGLDGFLFATSPPRTSEDLGTDIIADFISGNDLIVLSRLTFGLASPAGGGLTAPGDFAVVARDTQADRSAALIVFSRQNSILFYNPNRAANGLGAGGLPFAVVSNVTNLNGATNFLVIAGT